MATDGGATKEFGAKIPEDLYEEFRDLFPMYGATTWFINNSLRAFINTVRDKGTMQESITLSIKQMLEERRIEE